MVAEQAKRLIKDLLEVGVKFGFKAIAEGEIVPGSDFKVDVVWKIPMPDKTFFSEINVACMEVQYSKSPASITHNLCKAEKTLHPAVHFVISYKDIAPEHKEVLEREVPAGLVIIHGEEAVRELNLWITRFLTLKPEEAKIESVGKRILEFVEKNKTEPSELKLAENIRNAFAMDIKEVIIPPEVSSLVKFVQDSKNAKREALDEVFQAFVNFVKQEVEKYGIANVSFHSSLLFPTGIKIESNYPGSEIEFSQYIEITSDGIFARTSGGYPHSIFLTKGTAYLQTQGGTYCRYSFTTKEFKDFLISACQTVESTLKCYQVSEEEQAQFTAIKQELEKK